MKPTTICLWGCLTLKDHYALTISKKLKFESMIYHTVLKNYFLTKVYNIYVFQCFIYDFLAVMEAIPSIICDTLYSLGLHDQTPSWKIMDNKGRITVVLHWEPDDLAALKGDYEFEFWRQNTKGPNCLLP